MVAISNVKREKKNQSNIIYKYVQYYRINSYIKVQYIANIFAALYILIILETYIYIYKEKKR